MEIRRYESDLLSSNMYLIVENSHAIVIDPFRDTSPAKDLIIDQILITHEHYDHISGVNLWKEKTSAPVLCSKPCAENLKDPRKTLASIFEVFCELQTWIKLDKIPSADVKYSCCADNTFSDEIRVDWQGHRLHLFEMPGHSKGSIGILVDQQSFFSGDSLMEKQEIELRFPGGSKDLWKQVGQKRLAALPNPIRVYPGHFTPFDYSRKGEL